MTAAEDLEAVVLLACLTEDRTDGEQRSLLRVARKLDRQMNANTVGNRRMWGELAGDVAAVRQRPVSRLEREAEGSRVLGCDGDQREVHLPVRK